jgi:hypothetical protein
MRLPTTSRITLTPMLLSLLVTFWGCTKPDETKPVSSKTEPASSKSEPVQVGQSTPQKGSATATPGGGPSAPLTAAIATADGERAGTRVEITELKRSSDNTVTLKFAMVNDSDKTT